MPWKPHPSFPEPDHPNALIWRYMDMAKLVSLLSRRALFFCRASKLGGNDRAEAQVARWQAKITGARYRKLNVHLPEGVEEIEAMATELDKEPLDFSSLFEAYKEAFLISCWHLNEIESMAMWQVYEQLKRRRRNSQHF